jgi:hypothetical protein
MGDPVLTYSKKAIPNVEPPAWSRGVPMRMRGGAKLSERVRSGHWGFAELDSQRRLVNLAVVEQGASITRNAIRKPRGLRSCRRIIARRQRRSDDQLSDLNVEIEQ